MTDTYSGDLKLGEQQLYPNVCPVRCMKIYARYEKSMIKQQKIPCICISMYVYVHMECTKSVIFVSYISCSSINFLIIPALPQPCR